MLRAAVPEDVPVFFEYQADPSAAEMAAFAARDAFAHEAHWARILKDTEVIVQTILCGERVVGNVVSWPDESRRLVGYWVGREFWGRGIATEALRQFLPAIPDRPLHALVARHNIGSIRVLEKCGFVVSEQRDAVGSGPDAVEELLMVLSGR